MGHGGLPWGGDSLGCCEGCGPHREVRACSVLEKAAGEESIPTPAESELLGLFGDRADH